MDEVGYIPFEQDAANRLFAKSTFDYNVASRAERHCINETISPVSLGNAPPRINRRPTTVPAMFSSVSRPHEICARFVTFEADQLCERDTVRTRQPTLEEAYLSIIAEHPTAAA